LPARTGIVHPVLKNKEEVDEWGYTGEVKIRLFWVINQLLLNLVIIEISMNF